MAPVEPSFLNSNAGPLAALYTQVAVAGTLLALIAGNISSAHRNLPPSQHTRSQHALHRRGIAIFTALGLVGLALSAYFAVARRVVSYREWAHRSGENVPNTLWSGWYAHSLDVKPHDLWQLGSWMRDTNVWREGDEASVGSARAWWWTQQYFAALLAFSAYVGVEARRRNMPAFTVAALVPLASLVSLSVAMNLFYVALLLTPDTTGPTRRGSGYDPLWAPLTSVQVFTSVADSAMLLFTPHFPSAVALLTFQRWIIPIVRASLPVILPKSWGRRYTTASAARRAYVPLFSALAISLLVLQAKQTLLAVSDNAPKPSTFHFHWRNPSTKDQVYGAVDRTAIALNRILNVLHTHPAVAATAWDVILSSVSLCTWAAIRGTDPSAILKSSFAPWLAGSSSEAEDSGASSISRSKSGTHKRNASTASTGTTSKGTHKRKASASARKAAADLDPPPSTDPDPYPDDDQDLITSVSTANIIAADVGDDPAHSTRRGTRRKAAPRSRKAAKDVFEPDVQGGEEDADAPYEPTPGVKRAVNKMVSGREGEHGEPEAAAEAAGLAWGLFILGGLGTATSAVWGADGW